MAITRIKGITIQIGGDTTQLQQALKGVNKQLNSTQSALKDVKKLLKLDPGNVTLLKQRQKDLKQEIKLTKEQLEKEKTALLQLKDADKSPEVKDQMERLERQIIEDESALKRLQKEAREFGSVAKQQFLAVGERVQEFGKKVESAGQSLRNVGSRLTATVTTPIVAGFTAAEKTTADFDSSMAKVAAVTGAVGEEGADAFDTLRSTARKMGEQTVFTAAEAADAMYYMGLAGWTTEEIVAGIPAVLNLAVASGEDLATVSDIVTDSMTAFGLSADQTGDYVDVLAQASRRSNTTVTLMGESFKYAAPVAGALGFTVEDVAIALGLMADNGIKGSMAGTALRNVFQRMAKPTKESSEAMEALGLSLYDDTGEMYSFREIMDQMRGSFGQLNIPASQFNSQVADLTASLNNGEISEEEYQKGLEDLAEASYGAGAAEKVRLAAMLAGARGMPGLLAIVNASEEEYNELTAAIDGSSGAASEMAAVMRDNLNGQLKILLSKLQELAINVGDMLMPYLQQAVTWLQGVVDKLRELDDSQKEQIIKILLITAAIGPLLVVGGTLLSGIGKIIKFGGLLIKGIGMLLSPVGLVIAAIAVLAAGIVHLWETNEHFREVVLEVWGSIQKKAQEFSEAIQERLHSLGVEGETLKETLANAWDALWQYLEPVISAAVQWLGTLVTSAFDFLLGAFDTFSGLFSGDWGTLLTGLNEMMDAFCAAFGLDWEEIKKWMQDALDKLTNAGQSVCDFFTVIVPMKFDLFKKKVIKIVDEVKKDLEEKFELVKTTVTTKVTDLRDAAVTKFQEIRTQFGLKIDGIKTDAVNKWNAIKQTISDKLDAIKQLFNFSWSLPPIKTPHFKVGKGKTVLGVNLPSISVEWYKKAYENPYLFTRPTVMNGRGFGDGGGSGELVYGRDQLLRDIAQATNGGGVTINVYGTEGMNVNQLADAVQNRMLQLQRQREAAYA